MTVKIVVAGSLLHDVVVNAPRLPRLDESLAGSGVNYIAGGKGANQAVAASRHGATVAFAGRVGNDAAAQLMIAHLQGAQIDLSNLQRGTGHTGMSVAIVDEKGDFGAVTVAGANLDIDADAISLPDGTSFLVLQNEIPDSVNVALAERAKALGIKVVHNAAPARPVAERLQAATDLLIVNRIEAGMLTGMDVTDRESAFQAASSLAATVPEVIVTLGADGVIHCSRGGKPVTEPAFRAQVVSRHGAGDLFVGALVAQLAQGSEIDAAIHYAQAAAALHVSTPVDRRHLIRPMQVRNRLGED